MSTLDALRDSVADQATKRGAKVLGDFVNNSRLMESWLPFLYSYHGDKAPALLRGFQSSLVEAAGYAALGLAAAAMSAQRKAIDILHYWLFFAEQPLLWSRAQEDGSGFQGRDEVVKWLTKHWPKYQDRWQALEKSAIRAPTSPYSFLSKYIHAQSTGVMGQQPNIAGLVSEPEILEDLVTLQASVDEYLSDTLSARFLGSWPMLPENIRNNLSPRLGNALSKLI